MEFSGPWIIPKNVYNVPVIDIKNRGNVHFFGKLKRTIAYP
jgi:hypothetical protein